MKAIHPNRELIENGGKHAVKRGLLGSIHWENFDFLNPFVEFLVRAVGLYRRGYRNATDIRLEQVRLDLPRLPEAFEGYRLLWVSDIHVERFDHLPDLILKHIEPLEYDLCIFGGDSCFEHFISDKACCLTERLAAGLVRKSPVLGILGNHDFYHIAQLLDSLGVKMLLNDNLSIEREGQKLWFAGVDDCHYFFADDIRQARSGIPDDACKILLSHSPELYRQAEKAGFDACLSGHTHGGQICLPGGVSVISSASVPRRIRRGLWREKNMLGYTCRGSAASGAAVRFNCPAEITLFTLSGCRPQ
ncbi:MAG: metallophosphoesterase [Sedimentisphaerales bacterium]|nr:metallophosphoesterase [Sedimentisphaerales bacterium]